MDTALLAVRIAVPLLLLAGCSARQALIPAQTPEAFGGVLRVVGRFGFWSACPVLDGEFALGAAHSSDPRPFDSASPLFGGRWSNTSGDSGALWTVLVDPNSDLAVLRNTDRKPFPRPYRIASHPPLPGDTVRIMGYDHSHAEAAYTPMYTSGRVLRILSNNIVMTDNSGKGSSGGCGLNEAGEVMALPVWGPLEMKKGAVEVAVGVWQSIEYLDALFEQAREKVREVEGGRTAPLPCPPSLPSPPLPDGETAEDVDGAAHGA